MTSSDMVAMTAKLMDKNDEFEADYTQERMKVA